MLEWVDGCIANYCLLSTANCIFISAISMIHAGCRITIGDWWKQQKRDAKKFLTLMIYLIFVSWVKFLHLFTASGVSSEGISLIDNFTLFTDAKTVFILVCTITANDTYCFF